MRKLLKIILSKNSYNILRKTRKKLTQITISIKFPIKLLCYNMVFPFRYSIISRRLKKKEKINVAFFVLFSSIWKYDYIYHMMKKSPHYEPVIFICPYIKYGHHEMIKEMDQTFEYFAARRYKVVKVYNNKSNEWYNIKRNFKPDIILHTYPYKKFTLNKYFMDYYRKALHFYSPYAINISKIIFETDHFHSKVSKIFLETEFHRNKSQKRSYSKGKNLLVTGAPGLDIFFDKTYIPKNEWKKTKKPLKKIIWAPHHTIVMNNKAHRFNFSNFFEIAEGMLKLAQKYKNEIQIAVKMHPLLPIKLAKEDVWGEAKTNEYLKKWNSLPNAQIFNKLYYDLFLTSDAMVLDSASFIIEYISTNKPSIFIQKDENMTSQLHDFGNEALTNLYNGKNIQDIEEFIINTVISGDDPMAKERKLFIRKYIVPPNGNTASENIMNYINSEVLS